MASNELIVRIAVDCAAFAVGFIAPMLTYKFALDKSDAAHKREIESYKRLLRTSQCALEDEIVKNQEHRREIEKLRECLKDACSTELSCSECKSPCSEYTQDDCPIKKMWRKALKGERDA